MATIDIARRPLPQAGLGPAARRFFSPGNLIPLALLAIVSVLVVYPLAMVVIASFRDTAPGQAGSLTLEGWRTVLSDASTYRVLWSTFLIAFPRAALALAVATFFAWVIARTNTPFKGALEGMLVFMFFLPDLPWVLAWTLLGAPEVGLLNKWVSAVLPGDVSLIKLEVEVKDRKHLARIVRAIRQMPEVLRVSRYLASRRNREEQ